ncbi:hypothetical protein EYF80_018882 [Liparis tanakae]|uniref:Uncharacterized protein n=1 Tax=Liparis tanakae TaxID=230148 RepID=A0A4Z2HYT2_9TELE|nr:hypothetical protein EYF80_018882 [Liparis tanakae]
MAEEQLFGLPLVLRIQSPVVLLRGFRDEGQVPALEGGVLLKQLIQVPLDPQFVLKSLNEWGTVEAMWWSPKARASPATMPAGSRALPGTKDLLHCLRCCWCDGVPSGENGEGEGNG